MSLATLRKVTDEGVEFRSHLDGALVKLTPESVIAGQAKMGVDIAMVLDECVAAGSDRGTAERALRRTTAWAERARRCALPEGRLMFGIVQGGLYSDLRRQHAAELARLEFPGYAVGGLSVGEERGRTLEVAAETVAELPDEKPHYLMGVGLPQDLLRFIGMGFDMFDCVMPTRNGRNGSVFTHDGRLNMRLARHARAAGPIDAECGCYVCAEFSRGYVRHLMASGEMLGAQLASLHNLHYFLNLMSEARAHIAAGDFTPWAKERAERMDAGERNGEGKA
jgi:queuine tRNA-ribosyltransferase